MAMIDLPLPPPPSWLGKALGAALALVFAPADARWLAGWLLAGIALGHAVDLLRARLRGVPVAAVPLRGSTGTVPAGLRYAFAALGRIGAAGTPRPEHQRHAQALMNRLQLSPPRRHEALIWWHAGRDPGFPFAALAAACRHEFSTDPVFAALVERSLCGMAALVDTPRATARLLELGERVGYPRQALASRALAMAALRPPAAPLAKARALLGVDAGDAADVIRLAYRRRVARCHPDRLPRQASARQRAAAADEMWQLRDALELLLADTDR